MIEEKNSEINIKKIIVTKKDSFFKSIIPNEVQNLNKLFTSHLNSNSYSWEQDGERILSDNKYRITEEEKRILKHLFLKGIPSDKRAKIWLLISGAKKEIKDNPNYYNCLKDHYSSSIPSPFQTKIENDLRRTFPEDEYFSKQEILDKLKNILLVYSRRNVSIGYCQGFNFIVGRLLKVFDSEEEAFWVFVQIIENILPINYYSDMAGVIIDQYIFNKLLEIYLPEVKEKLDSLNFAIDPITIQWFVSIFSQNFNFDCLMIIWDVFILEGSSVLFKTALGMFRMLKPEILKLNSYEEVYEFIDNSCRNMVDCKSLMFTLIFRRFEFDEENIRKNRLALESEVNNNLIKNKQKIRSLVESKYKVPSRVSFVKEEIKECNKNWPICIYNKDYKENIITCLILQLPNNEIKVIDNYYNVKICEQDNRKCVENYKNDLNKVLLERQFHRCEKTKGSGQSSFKNESLKENDKIEDDEIPFEQFLIDDELFNIHSSDDEHHQKYFPKGEKNEVKKFYVKNKQFNEFAYISSKVRDIKLDVKLNHCKSFSMVEDSYEPF